MKRILKIVLYTFGIVITLMAIVAGFVVYEYKKIPDLNISRKDSQEKIVSKIDNWFQLLEKRKEFNGAVLLVKEGKPLLSKGYGWTNELKNERITKSSLFRLASVSKQFTAFGIMVLKEKNLLSYDDLIIKFIPNFPYQNIMIRNLLNQTSGIQDIYSLIEKSSKEFDKLDNDIIINFLIKENPKVSFKPNDAYEYSNTNYILLAKIIEVVSEQSFENFMNQEVFKPMNMQNARIWNMCSEDEKFNNKVSDLYFKEKDLKNVEQDFIDCVKGDGAIFLSLDEFLIWDSALYENPLISKENLEEAFKSPKLNNGKYSEYGFGWVLDKDSHWHNGGWLGARTLIVRNTKYKTCLVILDNSSNPNFTLIDIKINNKFTYLNK